MPISTKELLADNRAAAVIGRQRSVLARAQLTELGVGHDRVRKQLDAQRWQAIGPRIVVLHNGPLTLDQRRWAAVLNGGPCAALAAASAASAAGFTGFDRDEVEIVVRRGANVPPLDGVIVHESRRFSLADIAPRASPPRVSVERALVDMALWTRWPRRACAILAAGVQQKLTTASRLLTVVEWPQRGRHRTLLRATLLDIDGGSQALSELDFLTYCKRHGLPAPRRQEVRRDADGRRRYLDADFDGFSVEIDGAIHLRPSVAWADMDRHNALLMVGERQLRFPSHLIHLDDPAVARRIRAAIATFSRSPSPKSQTQARQRRARSA